MYDAMSEDLARLIVAAEREIRECAASGEHPAAAVTAARHAYSAAHRLGADDYARVSNVLGCCEKALKTFAFNPDGAAALLAAALRRLAVLTVRAEERLAAEELFC